MKRIFTILVLCVTAIPTNAQPFQVGHASMTFTDPSRSRDIPVEIYYPADVAGDNVAVAASTTEAFPVLSFGHGFVMTWSAYENLWADLVPRGFIMVFPKTETGILPSHPEFGKDLAFVISAMENLGTGSGMFGGRVSDMNAVMGHSMGGGSAFLAAAGDPNVTALLTLAPAETNPSAIAAAANLSIPSLIIAGGNDCVTPPATNTIPMYNGLASECKTFITITGGSHCQMADNNVLCSFGEATCSPSPAIDRDQQHVIINRYIGDWLSARLKSDCTAGQLFDSRIIADTDITFEKTCTLCDNLSVQEDRPEGMAVYPNPFSEEIEISDTTSSPKEMTIYDTFWRKVRAVKFSDNIKIDTRDLPVGLYLYRIVTDRGTQTGKLIKRN